MRFLLVLLCACGRVDFDVVVDAARDTTSPDVALGTCGTGARIAPKAAINASLSTPTDACSVDSVLALDTVTAGIDRGPTVGCPNTWDPNGSCGCVGVDLGASYPLSGVSVWAAPDAQACGTACQAPDCGTGHSFSVFVGDDLVSPSKIGAVTQDALAVTQDDVPTTLNGRYVIVCRQSWSSTRDDFAIDYIDAVCR